MIIGRDWVLHEIGYNILSKGGIPSLNSVPSSTITRHLLCGQPPINLCSHWIRLGIALIAPTMSQTHFWNVSSWMQHIDANISSGSYVLANNNTHNKCCGPATSGMLIAMSHNIKHLSRLIPNNDWCHCLLQPGPHNYCNPLSLHHTYEILLDSFSFYLKQHPDRNRTSVGDLRNHHNANHPLEWLALWWCGWVHLQAKLLGLCLRMRKFFTYVWEKNRAIMCTMPLVGLKTCCAWNLWVKINLKKKSKFWQKRGWSVGPFLQNCQLEESRLKIHSSLS